MSDDKVKKIVAGYLAEDIPLSDIQKLLLEDHEINMTFMELRLLSADLEVNWAKFDPTPAADDEDEEDGEESAEEEIEEGVQIEVSRVVRPGAMVSGSFECPSGAAGEWFIDQMGQLGVKLKDEEVTPTEDESMEFQYKLRELLSNG